MKLRVVKWGDYDDELPEGDNGWAARNAIIDNIRENGYDFSGWDHQECWYCTPILNDGKKYCYSQRGWGDLMAEAHEMTGETDYMNYYMRDEIDEMFGSDDDENDNDDARPQPDFSDLPEPETDLNETFEEEVDEETFENAGRGEAHFSDYSRLRYLYKGDTLVLTCGGKKATYIVTDAERKRFDDPKKREQMKEATKRADKTISKLISDEYNYSTLVLVVTLAPVRA